MQTQSAFRQALNPINSIIAKYLMRNVLLLLLAVFLVIALVIFGNQLVLVFKESLKAGIPIADLFPLISFKMIRDIPLILSLALFLAIILALSKLGKNSEIIVMNSMGIGDKHFFVFIVPVVMGIFVLILFLTTIAVPWSKEQRSLIMQRSENASEFSFIKQGEFQSFKDGEIVFYSSKVKAGEHANEQEMESIFIYALINEKPIITLAKQAQKYTDSATKSVYLRLKDGSRYHGFPGAENKKVLQFDEYDLQIIDGSKQQFISNYNKIEGRSTFALIGADGLACRCSRFWR
ncbi:MAG: LptF/LptG family permease [Candidatus Thioglobus sp.]|nr:LptF/LptG family permease [Candidatus Thioglobus sp.]